MSYASDFNFPGADAAQEIRRRKREDAQHQVHMLVDEVQTLEQAEQHAAQSRQHYDAFLVDHEGLLRLPPSYARPRALATATIWPAVLFLDVIFSSAVASYLIGMTGWSDWAASLGAVILAIAWLSLELSISTKLTLAHERAARLQAAPRKSDRAEVVAWKRRAWFIALVIPIMVLCVDLAQFEAEDLTVATAPLWRYGLTAAKVMIALACHLVVVFGGRDGKLGRLIIGVRVKAWRLRRRAARAAQKAMAVRAGARLLLHDVEVRCMNLHGEGITDVVSMALLQRIAQALYPDDVWPHTEGGHAYLGKRIPPSSKDGKRGRLLR